MIAAVDARIMFPSLADLSAPDVSDPLHGARQSELAQLREQAFAEGFEAGRQAGLEAARSEAATIFQAARDDGFKAGHAAAEQLITQAASALRDSAAALEELRTAALTELEEFAVEFSLAAINKLTAGKKAVSHGFIAAAVRAACEELKPVARAEIWLNPGDAEMARAELAGLPIKASPSIASGEFRVDGGALFVEG
ncbi:MAG: hypothetical protein ACREP6_01850, partial [Candidatus Binataceae bacterium]